MIGAANKIKTTARPNSTHRLHRFIAAADCAGPSGTVPATSPISSFRVLMQRISFCVSTLDTETDLRRSIGFGTLNPRPRVQLEVHERDIARLLFNPFEC